MSLHSSYHDFMDFQVSNIFFDTLKKTPPNRLKYFFVPELDYNGYLHVVKDQEEVKFRKDYRRKLLVDCRRQDMKAIRQRQQRREEFEDYIRHGADPSQTVLSPTQALKKSVKGKKTAMQQWADKRKRTLDARAVAMIEARMQQEAEELQMFEGWRAASQGSIRNKFRETATTNRLVEKQLMLPHTQGPPRSQSSLGFTQASSFGVTQSAGIPSEPPLSPALSCPSPVSLAPSDPQAPEYTATVSTVPDPAALPAGGRESLSPQEMERDEDADTYLQDTQTFDSTIDSRKVNTSQRLRSLALDATKTWTRPGPARSASSMR